MHGIVLAPALVGTNSMHLLHTVCLVCVPEFTVYKIVVNINSELLVVYSDSLLKLVAEVKKYSIIVEVLHLKMYFISKMYL